MSKIAEIQSSECVVTNRYGQTLVINKSIAGSFKRYGCLDKSGIDAIEEVLRLLHQPVCFDIGANIGNHTLVMSLFCKHVYLFEPQANIGIRLLDNLAANDVNNATCFPFGLSNKEQSLPLYVTSSGTRGASTFVPELARHDAEPVSLTIRIGDSVVQEHNIGQVDFIKIDVEGMEAEALLGLTNTINSSKPIVLMEWNNELTKNNFVRYKLFETLFADYEVMGIANIFDKRYWGTSMLQSLRRAFYKLTHKRRTSVIEFDIDSRYGNILLVPKSRQNVAQSIRTKFAFP